MSIVLKCKMSAFQAAIYDWVKTTGTLRLDPQDEDERLAGGNSKRPVRAYAPLQNKCMELRKVCNHPYLNYPPRVYHITESVVRSCGKLWVLDRILVKLHRTGHRVLLFSTMTKLLDILEGYMQWRRFAYRRIDGTTSLESREDAIVEFNRRGSDCFIFLLSIRAAGRGLNLQSADTVVIYDPDPNPKNEEQAVARAHRIGQKREVKVIYLEAVVETVPSFEKEDEIRSGGTVDDDDDMAGKDRYMGSVESLVRNQIQQHKIDMADEVINAGRFDQRTTQEERRLTLEALLHDEERYQETVHDVPSLQEVNRMIARSDEEVELFDQMDEEYDWPGELLRYQQVPKWLRVGSQEVNAAIAATSKQALKKGIVGTVGTREAEEKLLAKAAKMKGKANGLQGQKGLPNKPRMSSHPTPGNGHSKGKRKRDTEDDVIEEEVEDDYDPTPDVVMFDEEEEGEIIGGDEEELSEEQVDVNEEGEIEDEGQVEGSGEPVGEAEESEEALEQEADVEMEDQEDAGANGSSDDGEAQWEGSYIAHEYPHGTVDEPKRFGSLSALDSNPLRQTLVGLCWCMHCIILKVFNLFL